jgi:hypothetical protein
MIDIAEALITNGNWGLALLVLFFALIAWNIRKLAKEHEVKHLEIDDNFERTFTMTESLKDISMDLKSMLKVHESEIHNIKDDVYELKQDARDVRNSR